ncbi:MAG: nucleotide exchange factor GrpE [Clostridia bacterium]|nr:nucleotide exchange factor GrpE [Clostridia bacterium]
MMDEKRTEVPETELENEEAKSSEATEETKETAENTKLSEELEETKRKYLMMLAEYDNFRKRAQKERENAYGDAYADALTALLPVFDNLERASAFAGGDGMAEGITMIINQFKNALAGMGVESFGEVGDEFDPNLHNAIMQEENEELGENVISEVFQKGYKRGEKIIRFAMVKVANCG